MPEHCPRFRFVQSEFVLQEKFDDTAQDPPAQSALPLQACCGDAEQVLHGQLPPLHATLDGSAAVPVVVESRR